MHLGVILIKRKKTRRAGIAQLVEQWTENPRVTSSNLVPGIAVKNSSTIVRLFFVVIFSAKRCKIPKA